MWTRIKIAFVKHEIWALHYAKKVPIFAIFFASTLALWACIPILLLSFVALAVKSIWIAAVFPVLLVIYAALVLFLGFPGLVFFAPWFFRWYFVCVGLTFGKPKRADSKETSLLSRLAFLESKPARF